MKSLDFYKFIQDNSIEYHWHENTKTGQQDVIFFVSFWQIKDMAKILTPTHFDDEGIECVMKDGYFAFWASSILDIYGIELTEIFEKKCQQK